MQFQEKVIDYPPRKNRGKILHFLLKKIALHNGVCVKEESYHWECGTQEVSKCAAAQLPENNWNKLCGRAPYINDPIVCLEAELGSYDVVNNVRTAGPYYCKWVDGAWNYNCKNSENTIVPSSNCIGKPKPDCSIPTQTRTQNCPAKPNNTVWNTTGSYTQTSTDGGVTWLPIKTSTYNTTQSTTDCRYKCKDGYEWNGSSCVKKAPSYKWKCELLTERQNEQSWSCEGDGEIKWLFNLPEGKYDTFDDHVRALLNDPNYYEYQFLDKCYHEATNYDQEAALCIPSDIGGGGGDTGGDTCSSSVNKYEKEKHGCVENLVCGSGERTGIFYRSCDKSSIPVNAYGYW